MMNYPAGHHAAADPWYYRHDDDDAGEAAPVGGDTSSFADMIGDYSTDDLFGLELEQGGGGGAGAGTAAPGLAAAPEVRFDLPSEEEMAAWLRAIVKGENLALNNDGEQTAAGGRDIVPGKGSTTTTTDKKEKLRPMAEEEGMLDTKQQEMRKTPPGGSPKRSHHSRHHGEAHNLTEKRRRHKINEKLRTLQQLVPGCDKSNQASTLDQTIQYMKSLQHQVQAMCVGRLGPARPTAAYPVVQPQHAARGAAAVAVPMVPAAPVVLAAAPTMVPAFRAIVQLPHYPAAAVPAVMMPAAAAPLYPAAAPAAPCWRRCQQVDC